MAKYLVNQRHPVRWPPSSNPGMNPRSTRGAAYSDIAKLWAGRSWVEATPLPCYGDARSAAWTYLPSKAEGKRNIGLENPVGLIFIDLLATMYGQGERRSFSAWPLYTLKILEGKVRPRVVSTFISRGWYQVPPMSLFRHSSSERKVDTTLFISSAVHSWTSRSPVQNRQDRSCTPFYLGAESVRGRTWSVTPGRIEKRQRQENFNSSLGRAEAWFMRLG
jgi:hypothetical protein